MAQLITERAITVNEHGRMATCNSCKGVEQLGCGRWVSFGGHGAAGRPHRPDGIPTPNTAFLRTLQTVASLVAKP